jgi:hypothetical protein
MFLRRDIQFSSEAISVTCIVPSDWSTDGDPAVKGVALWQKREMLLRSGGIGATPVIAVTVVTVVRQAD